MGPSSFFFLLGAEFTNNLANININLTCRVHFNFWVQLPTFVFIIPKPLLSIKQYYLKKKNNKKREILNQRFAKNLSETSEHKPLFILFLKKKKSSSAVADKS